MKLSEKILEQLLADVERSKSIDDLLGKNGAIKNRVINLLEKMLGAQLSAHLGYEKHDKAYKSTNNCRNGKSSKTLNSVGRHGMLTGICRNGKSSKTLNSDYGNIRLDIPRDRKGEFDPVLIKKYQSDLGVIEDKVLSMYAKGMSTQDIQGHVEEIHGLELSPTAISYITEKVLEAVTEWQSRPLEAVYPIVYFDAIHFKVREAGRVITKAACTVLGIDCNGIKDLLSIWIGESKGANFWLGVLTEMRNRGLEDILICCADGIKGFPEAIETVFPQAEVQLCIIHQIRNSLRYISYKHQKEFMDDLKNVYKAPTEEAGRLELEKLEEKWGGKYALVINSWKTNWPRLSTFFKFPEEIRRIIYTTNIVEGLHRQFRKVTKTKTLFPNDDAQRKILFMAYKDIQKNCTKPIQGWAFIISQFAIVFKERLKLNL